jgi:hypothetical protein
LFWLFASPRPFLLLLSPQQFPARNPPRGSTPKACILRLPNLHADGPNFTILLSSVKVEPGTIAAPEPMPAVIACL